MTDPTHRAGYSAETPISTIFPETVNPMTSESDETDDNFEEDQASVWSKAKKVFRSNTVLLLIAASEVFFSLMNLSVKKLNSLDTPIPTFEASLFAPVVLRPKGVRLLLALRGFFGFFGLYGIYFSLQYLSLSDATVLTFLAPMCTAIVGAVILKEDLHWKQVVAGLFSLLGVVLIARPKFLFGGSSEDESDQDEVTPAQRLLAVGVALLGVCGATGAYVTIRAIGTRAHTMHSLISFSSQCVIVSAIAMPLMHENFVIPTHLSWLAMLLLIGFFGFVAQILLVMGLQRETAGRGTMALYIQIVFATIFDVIFFHTFPSPLSILGSIIIMGTAIYVAIPRKKTDVSLEEGLLANQEPEPETLEGDEAEEQETAHRHTQ
ncbi:hypothetical protein K474DRAFT_1711774 [Panus rudis PR-1116 ss-1]|nr:hypothetical protein K474DRAFT_1711774 [Panus rudis PR-1116 ss-1]